MQYSLSRDWILSSLKVGADPKVPEKPSKVNFLDNSLLCILILVILIKQVKTSKVTFASFSFLKTLTMRPFHSSFYILRPFRILDHFPFKDAYHGTMQVLPLVLIDPMQVLILGSGGLHIGQAGEFDYSGTQVKNHYGQLS